MLSFELEEDELKHKLEIFLTSRKRINNRNPKTLAVPIRIPVQFYSKAYG